jgi:uncharacterized membrane protein HdeD (DUF308 family)
VIGRAATVPVQVFDATSQGAHGLQPADSPDSVEPLRRVGRWWGLLLVFGLLTLALGIVITFRPGGTVRVLAILFGIWLLALGVFWIILAIAEHGEGGGGRVALVFLGLLSVLIGLLVLHHPFETVAVIGFIIGVFWVVGGVALLVAGLSREAEGRRTRPILLGLVYTITGIICLVYPGLSLTILAVILGIGLIISAIVDIVLAFQLRKLGRA